jgi:sarcosine oxidase, subunit gamma
MTELVFDIESRRDRLGLKGPRAAEWLVGSGITLPMVPNSWASWTGSNSEELLVARLGTTEFFLEETGGTLLQELMPALSANPPGVYPVLREDSAFQLSGDGAHEVLAQVCNVNFADLVLDSHPGIMTLMIGVAVLVVPQVAQGADSKGAASERRYRIWCDPTFGPSLGETLGTVVVESGGIVRELTGP